MRRLLILLVAGGAVAAPSIALANVNGQPANSIAGAYPTVAGMSYSGDFQTPTETEYLSFPVTQAGQSLHFALANTTASCAQPPSSSPCPVFATLVDGNGQQLGGEGSSAGTGQVDAGSTDVIDWTFAQPGTYYVAVDSSGDFPTFAVAYSVVQTPPGSAQTTFAPPVLASLSARSLQRGKVVKGVVRLRRATRRLEARLLHGSTTVGRSVVFNRQPGRVIIVVKLNRAGQLLLATTRKLNLKLRVVATPYTGSPAALARRITVEG